VRIFREGDEGPEILDIQQRLVALQIHVPSEDLGRFTSATTLAVRAFQDRRGLRADGLVGPDTWGRLIEAGFFLGDRTLYLQAPPMRGDDVEALQRKLNALGFDAGKEDGVYGATTDRATREFQRNVGEIDDGVVGLHTIDVLERMRPIAGVPSRALVRETEELLQMRSSLSGQLVAIDPGHAPEPGLPDIHLAMGRALADELAAVGAKPQVLRGDGDDPTPSQRARAANELGAALCLSLHLGSGLPEAGGPTCSYFGSETTHSPSGRHLAELILDELEHEFAVRGRLQRLTVAMLRETRMPAIQVEPLFATNTREAALIADPRFARRVGAAVASGVGRFFHEVIAPSP